MKIFTSPPPPSGSTSAHALLSIFLSHCCLLFGFVPPKPLNKTHNFKPIQVLLKLEKCFIPTPGEFKVLQRNRLQPSEMDVLVSLVA